MAIIVSRLAWMPIPEKCSFAALSAGETLVGMVWTVKIAEEQL